MLITEVRYNIDDDDGNKNKEKNDNDIYSDNINYFN